MCHLPTMVYVFQLCLFYILQVIKTPTSSLLCLLTFRCILGTTRLLSAAYRVTGRMQDSRRHKLENWDYPLVNTLVNTVASEHDDPEFNPIIWPFFVPFALVLSRNSGFFPKLPSPPIRIRGWTEKRPCVILVEIFRPKYPSNMWHPIIIKDGMNIYSLFTKSKLVESHWLYVLCCVSLLVIKHLLCQETPPLMQPPLDLLTEL